jgi:predicted dinucleotide-binding enzyme
MQTATKTVAVLGNGIVGVAVAKGFASLGYQVIFGTRNPDSDKSREALAVVPTATASGYADAAKAADLVFLALPWDGLSESLALAGPANFAGKTVIDAVNPLLDFAAGSPRLAVGFSDSAGELVQRLLPQARVVKAFNTIVFTHMVQPKFSDGQPDMFIAGNDAGAKQEVTAILRDFGWRGAIDMGDITAARLIEPLAMLWISYAFQRQHWTHGFSLLGQAKAE